MTDESGNRGKDAVVVGLVPTQEAVKDFGVDLRDFGQADLVRLFGVFSTREGRATKVDFKLQKTWIRYLESKSEEGRLPHAGDSRWGTVARGRRICSCGHHRQL